MKHLHNLPPSALEDFAPRFDRVLGPPLPTPRLSWTAARLMAEGWRGLYTADESILGWDELLQAAAVNLCDKRPAWLRASQEMGEHMLTCVPPKLMRGGSFATGEAHDHDPATGRPIYLCFRGFDWDSPHCEAQYLTLPEFTALLVKR